MSKYTDIMDEALMSLLRELTNDCVPFNIVISSTDNWEFPLPKNLVAEKHILLSVTGWALEQTYVVDGELYVRLAFGDNENSKYIKPGEIFVVMDDARAPLYQRVFETEMKKKTYTLKSLIGMKPNVDPAGLKNSMDTIKRHNKDKFKDNK